jgi:heme/copper-type cytochrome/quinol oxidase subunit 3
MIRPILTELAFFLAPFVAYAIFLVATRAAVFERASWPPKTLASLTIAALLLMLGSFLMLAHYSGAPPGSTYEPAHMENGKFVPGRIIPGQVK